MVPRRIKRSFVPQQESSDCGPSSLLSIIQYYGGEVSLQELRALCGTSLDGTSLLGLSHAAEAMGFDAQGVQVESLADLSEQYLPCIAVVKNDQNYDHFVVLYEYQNNTILLSDPACGVKAITKEEFEQKWMRLCLLLTPNMNFKHESEIRKEKRKWFKSILREDYPILTTSVFLGVFIAFISILMSLFSQLFIDKISPSHDKTLLLQGIFVLAFFLITHVLVSAGRNLLLMKQRREFNIRIIHSFFGKIINLPRSFFDTRSTGDMVARLNDTRRIQTVIETLFGETVISVFVAIVSFVFILYYSWIVAVICLLCLPLFFFVVSIKNDTIVRQQKEMMAANAMTESNYINTISGISDIKLYSKEDLFIGFNKSIFSVFQEKVFALGQTKISVNLLSGFGSTFVQLLIVSIGAYLVFKANITIGAFIAILGISGSLFSSVANLALMRIPINEARVAFDRMFELIMQRNKEPYPEEEATALSELKHSDRTVELREVSFGYPGRPQLFKHLNSSFSFGEITCVVGPSGSGKSTLCQLLGRLYDPSEGKIVYKGCDICASPIEEWRKKIAIVPQHPFLFPGTILDNICMGEKPDYKTLSYLFEHFKLKELLASFSFGLEMLVEENGKNLSGGQKQIVTLIRALYKQSEIIVLDEITAFMDYKCESLIYRILDILKKEAVVICVTHKLEVARKIGDRLVVLEEGVISADGTHENVLQSNNYYSNYWRMIDR